MLNRKIAVNMIECPDGFLLQSYHQHHFVCHVCENGDKFCVDGGLSYLRRTYSKFTSNQYKERSLYLDDDFEEIRKYFSRLSRGKKLNKPARYVRLCNMSDDWLIAVIEYLKDKNINDEYSELYEKELIYRKTNGISRKRNSYKKLNS